MGDPADIIVETLKEKGKHAQEGYVLVDTEHKVVWVNPYLEEKGYSLENVKGQLYCKIFEDKDTLDESCSTVRAFKQGQPYQKYIKGKDKKLYLIKSQPIEIEGKVRYVLEISKEVTIKRKAPVTGKAQPLSHTGLPLNEVGKYCFDAIFITDHEKNFVYVNHAYEKLTGYSSLDLIGKMPSIFQKPDGQGRYHEFKHAMENGEVWTEEDQRKRKDNTTYWVETKIVPLKNDAGVVTHYLGIEEDITQQQKLKKQLESYKSFPNNNTNPVLQTDYEGNFTILGETTKILFSEKKLTGSVVSIFGNKVLATIKEIKGKKASVIFSHEFIMRDQVYQVRMVDIPHLKVINYYFSDITEISRSLKELRFKNEDLEKFYKVGVGRELKMIELKKKLEAYEKTTKKPMVRDYHEKKN